MSGELSADFRGAAAIAAGSCHSLALQRDGTVVAVGDNGCGQCRVKDWSDIRIWS